MTKISKTETSIEQDIRWKQRFENFDRAFAKLQSFALLAKEKPEDVFQVALIGAFEFTFELGWKTLKDFLKYNGVDVSLPRDVIKQAFHHGLIEDGETWIAMLEDKGMIMKAFEGKFATEAARIIQLSYIFAIKQLNDYLLYESNHGLDVTPHLLRGLAEKCENRMPQ